MYTVPLKMRNANKWEDKYYPQLNIKAKYVPYPALRQQFWRCLLNSYDIDESGRISRVELFTMLDSIGSTLSEYTINSFFQRFQQTSTKNKPVKDGEELTIDQVVICLEDQLMKQQTKPAQKDLVSPDSLSECTVSLQEKELTGESPDLTSSPADSESSGSVQGTTKSDDKAEEHVIVISQCPLCHQPRMNKRSEVDIVTHIATCASRDWRQVDRFVMGGFVTSDQAHRKWYTKVARRSGTSSNFRLFPKSPTEDID